MASIHGKDKWKCSYQEEDGEQCVGMAGTMMMLQLCVDNWDFQLEASGYKHQHLLMTAIIISYSLNRL